MAAAAILFLVVDKFWGQPPILYPFLHTQFQIWWESVERFKSYSIFSENQYGGRRHLVRRSQATTAIFTALERAYMTS
jgi:hypothetical protein